MPGPLPSPAALGARRPARSPLLRRVERDQLADRGVLGPVATLVPVAAAVACATVAASTLILKLAVVGVQRSNRSVMPVGGGACAGGGRRRGRRRDRVANTCTLWLMIAEPPLAAPSGRPSPAPYRQWPSAQPASQAACSARSHPWPSTGRLTMLPAASVTQVCGLGPGRRPREHDTQLGPTVGRDWHGAAVVAEPEVRRTRACQRRARHGQRRDAFVADDHVVLHRPAADRLVAEPRGSPEPRSSWPGSSRSPRCCERAGLIAGQLLSG
jgi:hypothetical protein